MKQLYILYVKSICMCLPSGKVVSALELIKFSILFYYSQVLLCVYMCVCAHYLQMG